MATWTPPSAQLPADGMRCEVITESGDQRELIYDRNLWWLPDHSMYVYFTPRFWRPAR